MTSLKLVFIALISLISSLASANCEQGIRCVSVLVAKRTGFPMRYFNSTGYAESCNAARQDAVEQALDLCKENLESGEWGELTEKLTCISGACEKL